jgi:hydroxypyruvate isomerase
LNLDFVIEPLNTLTDHPGYFLDSTKIAFEIILEIHHPRVRVLCDIYHMAVMGENLLGDIERHMDPIGYFHVADAPGRNEPGAGDFRYGEISALLRKLDYRGVVRFEYSPSNGRNVASINKALKAFE